MVLAFRCATCRLIFEGLHSYVCPSCDSSEEVKKVASYPYIHEKNYKYQDEIDQNDEKEPLIFR